MLSTEVPRNESFTARPAVSETFARTVEAPLATVQAAAGEIDLIGSLVEGLIALGVDDHIVTPCSNGLVWRFGAGGSEQVRIAWAVSVAPETEDATHVGIALHATASDETSRERLYEAWPVLGPVAELHAQRVLHRIEALAEDAAEDPFES